MEWPEFLKLISRKYQELKRAEAAEKPPLRTHGKQSMAEIKRPPVRVREKAPLFDVKVTHNLYKIERTAGWREAMYYLAQYIGRRRAKQHYRRELEAVGEW
jgi:hypothetical protein